MISIKYFLQKNISYQTKIIILAIAGVVFLLVFVYSFWNQYFSDTLIKYAPNDAVFYAHFSQPKIKSSLKFDGIILAILAEKNLTDLPLEYLKRELAVIGQSKESQLIFSLILRTDEPAKLKQLLKKQELNYKFLDSNRVLISESAAAGDFIKNRKNNILAMTKGKFSRFNSLSIYAGPGIIDYFSQDVSLLFLYNFFSKQDNLYLNFQVKRNGLKIFGSQKKSGLKWLGPKLKCDLVGMNFDLLLMADNPGQLIDDWQKQLMKISPADYSVWQNYLAGWEGRYDFKLSDDLIQKLFSRPTTFLARKNQINSGSYLRDYDFYLFFTLGQKLNETEKAELEIILKKLLAPLFPRVKIRRLIDGTIVKELILDSAQFEFRRRHSPMSSANNFRVLVAPDQGLNWYYQVRDDKLIIYNNPDWLTGAGNINAPPNSCLKINIDLLPANTLWQYLKSFDYIETEGDALIFR